MVRRTLSFLFATILFLGGTTGAYIGNIGFVVPMGGGFDIIRADRVARVRAKLSGLPKHKWGSRVLMVWQAFVDESGGRGHSPVMVLGGLIAPHTVWETFTKEWDELLKMRPTIDYFKMNEAYNLEGEFRGWDPIVRDERVRAFYRTIETHVAFQVSAIIHLDALSRVAAEYQLDENPYYLAFSGILSGVGRNQRVAFGISEKVSFVFDERLIEKQQIYDTWDWYKNTVKGEHKDLLGSLPAFENDLDFLPLQAADLAAWWIRKLATEEPDRVRRVQFPWTSKRQIPGIQMVYNEERIRKTCETLISLLQKTSP
jgi:hypothetical protein